MSPPHVVGIANGIAQSIVSLARFFGPIIGGVVSYYTVPRFFVSISHESPTALVDKCPGQPEWLSHWIPSLFGYMCSSSRTQFLYTVTLGMVYIFVFIYHVSTFAVYHGVLTFLQQYL